VDKFLLIPTYPEQIQDNSVATFNSTSSLARSAPVYSYSHSGPRTVQISLRLHREMMTQLNYSKSNVNLDELDLGASGTSNDYVDFLIKQLQAIALPKYSATDKMVDPPMVAVRFGNEIYIKGVVDGGVSVTYSGPILNNDKYAIADVSFTVHEVDPYDAESV
jgi:peptidoglycan hydrolase-like protein with peptidoglycan-binding domain